MTIRFEDIVIDPEGSLRAICAFAGLRFDERMFEMGGGDEDARTGGNSSFDSIPRGEISRRPIGRYRNHLEPELVAVIQGVARRQMLALEYELDEVDLSPSQRVEVVGSQLVARARMAAWEATELLGEARGRGVPDRRLRDRDG